MSKEQALRVATDPKDIFLKNLRAATGPAHVVLEQNPYTTVLMTPHVSIADYITYLQRLYGFVAPVEAIVYPAMHTVVANVPQRIKAHYILEDLRAAGVSEETIRSLPQYDATAFYTTGAEKIAAMYVLEGASLGGNVIFRHLQKTTGITPEKTAYLTAYGAKTGIMWQQFIEAFTGYVMAQDNADEVISAAAATFGRIDNWLTNQQ
jgi:heme oxygenase